MALKPFHEAVVDLLNLLLESLNSDRLLYDRPARKAIIDEMRGIIWVVERSVMPNDKITDVVASLRGLDLKITHRETIGIGVYYDFSGVVGGASDRLLKRLDK